MKVRSTNVHNVNTQQLIKEILRDTYNQCINDNEGNNLDLSSYTFEYNIPVTQGTG